MPTNGHYPADTLRPATPVGYQPPQPFRYSPVVLLGFVMVLMPVAAVVFGASQLCPEATPADTTTDDAQVVFTRHLWSLCWWRHAKA